jgi:hypothetical protein
LVVLKSDLVYRFPFSVFGFHIKPLPERLKGLVAPGFSLRLKKVAQASRLCTDYLIIAYSVTQAFHRVPILIGNKKMVLVAQASGLCLFHSKTL